MSTPLNLFLKCICGRKIDDEGIEIYVERFTYSTVVLARLGFRFLQ